MPMIGGDLGAMDALARRFDHAGGEFRQQSTTLVNRAAAALDEYVEEMGQLDRAARLLDDEIGRAQIALRQQADATEWTGAHRHQQDALLALLESDIRGVRTAIADFLEQSGAVVNGALTLSLTEMQREVSSAGSRAELIAGAFARAVTQQRQAFDLVMNG
jgi:hypothetical protein